jgi:D-alanyl-D-alanine dipeptidase
MERSDNGPQGFGDSGGGAVDLTLRRSGWPLGMPGRYDETAMESEGFDVIGTATFSEPPR